MVESWLQRGLGQDARSYESSQMTRDGGGLESARYHPPAASFRNGAIVTLDSSQDSTRYISPPAGTPSRGFPFERKTEDHQEHDYHINKKRRNTGGNNARSSLVSCESTAAINDQNFIKSAVKQNKSTPGNFRAQRERHVPTQVFPDTRQPTGHEPYTYPTSSQNAEAARRRKVALRVLEDLEDPQIIGDVLKFFPERFLQATRHAMAQCFGDERSVVNKPGSKSPPAEVGAIHLIVIPQIR